MKAMAEILKIIISLINSDVYVEYNIKNLKKLLRIELCSKNIRMKVFGYGHKKNFLGRYIFLLKVQVLGIIEYKLNF